ncbi:MAG: LysM peptidoglycan-binding domain-containing protein [Treponema sp.]|nr:LysM peptidoglycan-binding domain-containing protein [Treponema sp.]
MKQIGIKLADGSFYPLLEEGTPSKTTLDLTTASDNQTTVAVDLYSSETGSIENAEYIDTLQIDNLVSHPNGEPSISFSIALDENDELSVEINDPESGIHSNKKVSLSALRSRPSGVSSKNNGAGAAAGLVASGVLAAALKHTEKDDNVDFSDLDLPDDIDLTKPVDSDANDFAEPEIRAGEMAFASDGNFTEPVIDESISFADEDTQLSDDSDISISKSVNDYNIVPDDFPSFDNTEASDASSEVDDSAALLGSVAIGGVALGAAAVAANDESTAFEDDFFSDMDNDAVSSNADSFSDTDSLNLDEQYTINNTDEETATNTQSKEAFKKKTKAPVLICILCALICIIATLLILFVIPSRFNVFGTRAMNSSETVARAPSAQTEHTAASSGIVVQEESRVPVQQQVAPAKVNEVVVAPKSEVVVPERPASSARSSSDVVYRIKWGDTLWDIADAYYKNPWRYQRIARYNNIRNPDYIISGTTIVIPAE